MSVQISTPYGTAVPPAYRHAVTVHMPGWKAAEAFAADPGAVIRTLSNMYPRMKIHKDVAQLGAAVIKVVGEEQKTCFLFTSIQTAQECILYATSPLRDDGLDKKPVAREQIALRAFQAKDLFYAVLFSPQAIPVVFGFWSAPGSAMSSRFAEANLAYVDRMVEVAVPSVERPRSSFDSEAHDVVRNRIADLLGRSREAGESISKDDVYLYPSGMTAIYKPHVYSLRPQQGTTVLFGMAFMHTLVVFTEHGPGVKWFGVGTDKDLDQLAEFLAQERLEGRNVQAVWTEYPANPIITTPNLIRLRELANEYDVLLAVDDTIGSFANVDVLSAVDLVVTSLTKSFNGHSDVLAGSAVLNAKSRKYRELKTLFDKSYVPELYVADAEMLEVNSRDYLARTAILNRNALTLVNYLSERAADPASAVTQVFYPTTLPTGENYKRFMRPATADFTPGYGCLFSVEFDDLASTASFYEHLNTHKGPHLGAQLTLVLPYTLCLFGRSQEKLDEAAALGMRPTQIRVSVGLEDDALLLEDFRVAIEVVDAERAARRAAS